MSGAAFAAILLLAAAPGDPGGVPTAATDQQVPAPAPAEGDTDLPAPVVPAESDDAAPGPGQSEIVVTGQSDKDAGDPLAQVNAKSFAATQAVDKAVVGPVARAYQHGVPKPVRSGIHNFLYNLREPVVFLNYLVQLKPGKAGETLGRFVINSTVGAAGVIDMAKRRPFNLPRRANGFADTLGYYGVKPGLYLFLPIVGPTTIRDLIGGTVDRFVLPVAVGQPFTQPVYTIPAGVLGAVDHRADFDEPLKALHDGTVDPYAASRTFYLERRQAEIDGLRGRRVTVPGPPAALAPAETPPAATAMPVPDQAAAPVAPLSAPPSLVEDE